MEFLFDEEFVLAAENILTIFNRNKDEKKSEECKELFTHLPYNNYDLDLVLPLSSPNGRALLEDQRHVLRSNIRTLNTQLHHRNNPLTDELEDQALEHKREIKLLKEKFAKNSHLMMLQVSATRSQADLDVKILKDQLEFEKAKHAKEIEELNRAINYSLTCSSNLKDISYGAKIPFRRIIEKLQYRVKELDHENKKLRKEKVQLLISVDGLMLGSCLCLREGEEMLVFMNL